MVEKPKIALLCGSSRFVDIMAVSQYLRLADFLRRLQTFAFGQGRRLADLIDAGGVQLVLRDVGARKFGVPEVGTREDGVREVGAKEVGVHEVGAREVGARGWRP